MTKLEEKLNKANLVPAGNMELSTAQALILAHRSFVSGQLIASTGVIAEAIENLSMDESAETLVKELVEIIGNIQRIGAVLAQRTYDQIVEHTLAPE